MTSLRATIDLATRINLSPPSPLFQWKTCKKMLPFPVIWAKLLPVYTILKSYFRPWITLPLHIHSGDNVPHHNPAGRIPPPDLENPQPQPASGQAGGLPSDSISSTPLNNELRQTQPPMDGVFSPLNQEEEAPLFRLAWKIFIPTNIGAIIALSTVCLMEKLPREWLKFNLILVLCLMALALVLSTFPLLLAPYLKIKIKKVHQKYIKDIFVVLTMLAVLIIVGTCVAYLTTKKHS